MVWAEISLEARTELYIIPRGSLAVDEALQDFVVPHVNFIGNNFIMKHGNTRLHTARIIQQYLNDVDTDVLEWPISSDANPIEHVWDMLGRRIRTRNPIALSLNELQYAVLDEWDLISQKSSVIKNAPAQFLLAMRLIFQ
nr:unnamed protein product [Callosobruchus chinensis]